MGGGTGRARPSFSDGPEFETIGSRGFDEIRKSDERFARIVCASCGATLGMALHGAGGPAYCTECWEKLDDGGGGGGGGGCDERSAAGMGDDERECDGAACGGRDRAHGDDAPAGSNESGYAGGNGNADSGEQVRRMRALMRSLEAGGAGPPTRRQVLEGMVLDGGGGAWKDGEAAEWCLDNVLAGIVYEPEAGCLSMIDGE